MMNLLKNHLHKNHRMPLMGENRFVYFDSNTTEKLSAVGLYNFGNKINELEKKLEAETDEEQMGKLREKLLKCREELAFCEKPIENENDVTVTIEEIKDLNDDIAKLDKTLKYQDLLSDSQSDSHHLSVFFDEKTINELNEKLIIPKKRLSFKRTLVFNKKKLQDTALENWKRHRKNWGKGQKTWQAYQKAAKKGPKALGRFIQKLNKGGKALPENTNVEPTDDGRDAWLASEMERLRIEADKKAMTRDILDLVPKNAIDKIHSVFVEARAYRIEALKKYVWEKFDRVKKQYEKMGWPVKDLKLIEKGLENEELYANPDNAKILVERLNGYESRTDILADDYRELGVPVRHEEGKKTETSPVIEETKKKLTYIREAIALTPEQGEGLKAVKNIYSSQEEYRLSGIAPEDQTAFDETGKSVLHQKNLAALEMLKNPEDRLGDLEKVLNGDYVSSEEIRDAVNEIDLAHRKLKNRKTANRAREVVRKLGTVSTLKEMLNIVESEEHIEYVSSREFEKKYRKYTATGYMVFYQRGEQWKIIIDEESLKKKKKEAGIENVFKEQMTHELRHVVFDYDEKINQDCIAKYTHAKNWETIKKAFVEKTNHQNPPKTPPDYSGPEKKAFDIDDWKDENVVSELYAMEEEITGYEIKSDTEDDPFNNLCREIGKAGLLATAIKGFEKDKEPEKEIIKGFEEGAAPTAEETEISEMEGGPETHAPSDFGEQSTVVNLEEAQRETDVLKQRMKDIRNHEHFSYIAGAGELLDLIEKALDRNSGNINLIQDAKDDINDLANQLATLSTQLKSNAMNPLRMVWNHTTFLSIGDIIHVGKSLYEFYDRRHKRRKESNAAELGIALFKGLPWLNEVGMDATANKEKAESEYVNEWKGRFENKDAWELLKIIDHMGDSIDPDKDQLKAALRVLADKGRIDWQQKGLWRVLNKVQSKEHFRENDPFLLNNPAALRQKLMSALGQIWDYDEFLTLDSKNTSSYESKKKEYIDVYDKMQGQLDDRLIELLRLKRQGQEADPIEYEAIMEYAILKGKSHEENVMFHLFAGMAAGLLSADRGIHLDKYLNDYPALEWFTNATPPPSQFDFERICMTYFPGEYKEGAKGDNFQNYYWTVIQNDIRVLERVEKSCRAEAWDHDWCRSIAPLGGADAADRFLRGRSGQKETRPTAVQNSLVGVVQWLDENAKKGGESWENGLARQIGWCAMTNGIMENVYMKDSEIYTRKEAYEGGKIARLTNIGHHKNQTVETHLNRIHQVMDMLDPRFFQLIRNKELRDADEKGDTMLSEVKSYMLDKYPQAGDILNTVSNIDQLFKRLQPIIMIIVEANKHRLGEVANVLVDKNKNIRPL